LSRSILFIAAGALIFAAPLCAADQEPATVEMILPAKCKVYLDDKLIRSTAGTHRLDTPPLEKNRNYSYTFRVEIEQDGKSVTFTKKITVQAGATVKADFTDLATAPADPPGKPETDKPKTDKPTEGDKPKSDKVTEGDKPNPDKSAGDKPKSDKPADGGFKMSDIEKAIIDATNAERKKKDLPELKPNPRLFDAARKHSELMARVDKLSHKLDDESKMEDRVKATGYRGYMLGENVSCGPTSAEEVVKGWMNSEGHRANILNGTFTEIGVGVAKNEKGMLYFTQVFGKPLR
jgi:uncharacterized protein (TIGR03000 family)